MNNTTQTLNPDLRRSAWNITIPGIISKRTAIKFGVYVAYQRQERLKNFEYRHSTDEKVSSAKKELTRFARPLGKYKN